MTILIKCPHNRSKAYIRSTEEISNLTRKQYNQCSNIYCDHTFTTMQSVLETIVASARPDPIVKILVPLSSRNRQNILIF
ncbi:ogr/Delta-like zinc finger family protein [uncultured Gilliamella sp.]|uniref:ogr/Delta-like zinc finger family protein n=1 Tax=uncultured Gilliamella sp. TaxID=1193505 RepID=UPI003453669E